MSKFTEAKLSRFRSNQLIKIMMVTGKKNLLFFFLFFFFYLFFFVSLYTPTLANKNHKIKGIRSKYLYNNISEHSKQGSRNLRFRGTVLLKDSIFPWATKTLQGKVCFLSIKYRISYFKGQLNYTGILNLFTLPFPHGKKS